MIENGRCCYDDNCCTAPAAQLDGEFWQDWQYASKNDAEKMWQYVAIKTNRRKMQ